MVWRVTCGGGNCVSMFKLASKILMGNNVIKLVISCGFFVDVKAFCSV